jgi:hypothetical protein
VAGAASSRPGTTPNAAKPEQSVELFFDKDPTSSLIPTGPRGGSTLSPSPPAGTYMQAGGGRPDVSAAQAHDNELATRILPPGATPGSLPPPPLASSAQGSSPSSVIAPTGPPPAAPSPALASQEGSWQLPLDLTAGGSAVAGGAAPPLDYAQLLTPPQQAGELGRLGPYRVLRLLGTGAMGAVFMAEDIQLARPVALKVMLPALSVNPDSRARFLREARAAAAIQHDHIVTVFQVGEDRGVPFLAMQLLEGETLEDRLRRPPPLLVPTVLRLAREIADGLAAAHQRGLLHRDVKPSNIWLEAGRDRVKILDFGLARGVGEDARLTRTGTIIGTPAYMAPEQARGRPLDHRSDLFSLGCLVYRMCTGELPFKGEDTLAMLSALAMDEPAPMRDLNVSVPPALSILVKRLLSKDAAGRPASAREVVETLARIEQAVLAAGRVEVVPMGAPVAPPVQTEPTRILPARVEPVEDAVEMGLVPDRAARRLLVDLVAVALLISGLGLLLLPLLLP